jgi:hypothetical protein
MTDVAVTLIAISATIIGLSLYVLIGGLVVRGWNAIKPFGDDSTFDDACDKGAAAGCWPLALAIVLAVAIAYYPVVRAYRISQWSPRRKSTLPGARVVR